ncbi:MAG: PAS domain S-box protein [Bacteroidia bacterium]|nr:PAS domain S-box protein [Bacteroidia bacterium]
MNSPPINSILDGFIFNQAIEGMLLAGRDGKIIRINPACLKILGYTSEEELIGKEIEVAIPNLHRNQHKEHRNKYFRHPHPRAMGENLNLKALKKSGEEIEVEISLSPLETKDNFFVLAHVMDVSLKRKLQDQHLTNEKLLHSIIQNAVDGIITIDERGTIESLNPAAAYLFGYKPEEVYGKNVKILMPEPYHSSHDGYIENYQRTGERKIIGIGREVMGKRKDGSTFPIKLSVSEVIVKDRKIYTGIIHDISSMKEAEQKLKDYAQELERSNRELEDFAYVSSHDLQEPLRKIQAFGNYIQDREAANLSPKGKDYLNRMLNAASRLQKLINDLLSYSRVSTKAQPFKEVNLNKILGSVLSDLEILIQNQNAKILTEELPTIEADATQMGQLLQNLISNAIKFGKEGVAPMIQIESRVHEIEGNDMKRKWVSIEVKDNGIGFDLKYSEKIFSIFQRLEGRKYPGSGVGLSIVKRIVHRHGGNIEVDSEKGKGTTFRIYLPKKQAFKKVNND